MSKIKSLSVEVSMSEDISTLVRVLEKRFTWATINMYPEQLFIDVENRVDEEDLVFLMEELKNKVSCIIEIEKETEDGETDVFYFSIPEVLK